LLLALLLLGGCGRPNPRASVTVHLPPAKAAMPAPGFSSALTASVNQTRG